MRTFCAGLAGAALFTCGCSVFWTRSGEDLSALQTRDQVRMEFGEPTFIEPANGSIYETFHTTRKISEQVRANELAAEISASYGFAEFVAFPGELVDNAYRILYGQTLCFRYDQRGNVLNVFLNDQPFLSHGAANEVVAPPPTGGRP
jgi:hypothetical protein